MTSTYDLLWALWWLRKENEKCFKAAPLLLQNVVSRTLTFCDVHHVWPLCCTVNHVSCDLHQSKVGVWIITHDDGHLWRVYISAMLTVSLLPNLWLWLQHLVVTAAPENTLQCHQSLFLSREQPFRQLLTTHIYVCCYQVTSSSCSNYYSCSGGREKLYKVWKVHKERRTGKAEGLNMLSFIRHIHHVT